MKRFLDDLVNDCDGVFCTKEFNDVFYYDKKDLGATYDKEGTLFKLWSPVAIKVNLNLYKDGHTDSFIESFPMEKGENGTWGVYVNRDLDGIYYTYEVSIDNMVEMPRDNNDNVRFAYSKKGSVIVNETGDPYAKAVGVNGIRSMVVNLEKTNPYRWNEDTKPEFKDMTDAVIYELHIRDLSMDEESGIIYKGKFLGLTEEGTTNKEGYSTGLDHMKDLGITHVHILPSYDYETIDETRLQDNEYNWGYDPKNYNTPEGSYSTNPYDGRVRIREFKEMVKKCHENGIRVIMDVVYNHTYSCYDSCFTKTVPNYYYRTQDNINTNGSGCGNETASNHIMFRKYMIDSVLYWAKEYHVDGFRFDLMAVHDIDTMNELCKAVKEYDSSLIIYGEGWTGGPSKLPFEDAAFKVNAPKIPQVAMFSDDIRDALKGSVMEADDMGYVNGGLKQKSGDELKNLLNILKFGICASTKHPQVKSKDDWDYKKAPQFWANDPTQCISYVSVHDNWTLWDKLALTCSDKSEEERIKMNKLIAAVILSSQGIPLFQAGEELLRSKPIEGGYEENSYRSPDSVNCIRWANKTKYIDVFNYYKGLIEFRKAHKALRMTDADCVANCIHFEDMDSENVIVYTIDAKKAGDSANEICVIINGNENAKKVNVSGKWQVYVNENTAGTKVAGNVADSVICNSMSVMILAR